MCQLIMGERFPDLADNPLVLVILMLVTSPSVQDCSHIIDLIMARATAHQEINIMETIYFLLSHLVIFKDRFMPPEKIVYILRHSIQLYYNQSSLGSRELTSEQRRIVNMDMKSLKMSPKMVFKTNLKQLPADCHKSTSHGGGGGDPRRDVKYIYIYIYIYIYFCESWGI